MKAFEPKDVIGEDFIKPDGKPIPKCRFMKQGQEFLVEDTGAMPSGFCEHAWYGIKRHVDILRYGGSVPDWTGEDTMYSACPDGIRPVCFKLERIKK